MQVDFQNQCLWLYAILLAVLLERMLSVLFVKKVAVSENRVIFFDGVCGMCNALVDFLITRDQRNTFRYTPLQGTYASETLPEAWVSDLNTVVYLRHQVLYTRSSAVLQIARDLGGLWALSFYLFYWIPKPLRDLVYRLLAPIRYQLFGKKETCRLPTAEERERFLD